MTPIDFLQFKMMFYSRWPFSEISGQRTKSHNDEIGGHYHSWHLVWLATDGQFDYPFTSEEMDKQRHFCKRMGITIVYKDNSQYFHLEPATP